MKNSIALERYNNHFYVMQDDAFEDLRYLVEFLSTDYRYYDQNLFNKALNFYNTSFVYHDFSSKNLYVGFSEWEILTEIPVPCDYTFPDYVNGANSCKISMENFLEFRQKWVQLKKDLPLFAVIYRDDNDWVACKGFDSKEDMELFVKNYTQEVIH